MKIFFLALCFIAISFDHSDAHCCGPNIDIFVSNLHNTIKLVPKFTLYVLDRVLFPKLSHSMLRLDATTKKKFDSKLFKFKKFSIK